VFGWLMALLLPAQPVDAASETELPKPGECALWAGQARRLARRLLERAVQSEQAELARFYVETAYQLSPAPQLLYNLGMLSLRTGHHVEGADLLRRYQAELGGELPDEHRAVLDKALHPLPMPSYQVALETTVDAVVFVDDRLVGRAPLRTPLLLPSGPHRLRIEHGYRHAEAMLNDPGPSESGTRHSATPLALPLPNAVALIAPELSASQQRRLTSLLSEQGITTVPARDRELLLAQLPDRTGCLTQPSCQLWLGEQLDVEYVIVVRSLDMTSSSSERVSQLSLEVMTVPQGTTLFRQQSACPSCSASRSDSFLQALVRMVRRELPTLTVRDPAAAIEPAPSGFVEVSAVRLSPCALARGTARRLARRLLVEASGNDGDLAAKVRIETAYQLSPSPLLLYNLGLWYRRAGQTQVAADLMNRFWATAGPEVTAERRAKAEALINLASTLPNGLLTLSGPAGALVFVDGRLHGALPLESPLWLTTGPHRVVLETGYRTAQQELTLRSGEERALTLALPDAVLLLSDETVMAQNPALLMVAHRAAEDAGLVVIPERDRERLVQSAPDYRDCERSLLCMRRVGKMLGAQSVIMLERRRQGLWAGRLLDSDDGALTSGTSEGCRTCDSDDLAVRRVIRELAQRRHAPRARPLLDSQPPVPLLLDGFVLGPAPQRLLLTAGEYRLSARLSLTRSMTGLLRVPQDPSLTLRFSLDPRRRLTPQMAVGISLLTGGAILLATGMGLWVDATRSPLLGKEAPPRTAGLYAGPILVVGGVASVLAGGLSLGLRSR